MSSHWEAISPPLVRCDSLHIWFDADKIVLKYCRCVRVFFFKTGGWKDVFLKIRAIRAPVVRPWTDVPPWRTYKKIPRLFCDHLPVLCCNTMALHRICRLWFIKPGRAETSNLKIYISDSEGLWATNTKSAAMTAINVITRHRTPPIFLTTIDCHMGSTNHAHKAAVEKKIPIVKWIPSFWPRLFHLTGQNRGEKNKKTRSHRLRSIRITIRLLNYNLNTLAIYSDKKEKSIHDKS